MVWEQFYTSGRFIISMLYKQIDRQIDHALSLPPKQIIQIVQKKNGFNYYYSIEQNAFPCRSRNRLSKFCMQKMVLVKEFFYFSFLFRFGLNKFASKSNKISQKSF